MILSKKLLLIVIIIAISMNLLGIYKDAGTTGFTFLETKFSAQAAARANTFNGFSDDADAVYFVPAGLNLLEEKQVKTSYVSYLEGFNGCSIVYAMPYTEKVGLAFFTKYMGTNSIEKTGIDSQGNYIPTNSEFGSHNVVMGVSAGKYINDLIDLGGTAKYIYQTIDSKNASAVAFDLSLLHQTNNEKLKVGVSVRNLGKQLTYYTDEEYDEKMPITAEIGLGLKKTENLQLSASAVKPIDNDYFAKIGVEYRLNEIFKLRSGFKSNYNDWNLGGDLSYLSGISLGFGLNWKKYIVDYAIYSYGDLGFVNQVSLAYNF